MTPHIIILANCPWCLIRVRASFQGVRFGKIIHNYNNNNSSRKSNSAAVTIEWHLKLKPRNLLVYHNETHFSTLSSLSNNLIYNSLIILYITLKLCSVSSALLANYRHLLSQLHPYTFPSHKYCNNQKSAIQFHYFQLYQ